MHGGERAGGSRTSTVAPTASSAWTAYDFGGAPHHPIYDDALAIYVDAVARPMTGRPGSSIPLPRPACDRFTDVYRESRLGHRSGSTLAVWIGSPANADGGAPGDRHLPPIGLLSAPPRSSRRSSDAGTVVSDEALSGAGAHAMEGDQMAWDLPETHSKQSPRWWNGVTARSSRACFAGLMPEALDARDVAGDRPVGFLGAVHGYWTAIVGWLSHNTFGGHPMTRRRDRGHAASRSGVEPNRHHVGWGARARGPIPRRGRGCSTEIAAAPISSCSAPWAPAARPLHNVRRTARRWLIYQHTSGGRRRSRRRKLARDVILVEREREARRALHRGRQRGASMSWCVASRETSPASSRAHSPRTGFVIGLDRQSCTHVWSAPVRAVTCCLHAR